MISTLHGGGEKKDAGVQERLPPSSEESEHQGKVTDLLPGREKVSQPPLKGRNLRKVPSRTVLTLNSKRVPSTTGVENSSHARSLRRK